MKRVELYGVEVDELFNVTPKEYAALMRKLQTGSNKGISDRTANRYFRQMAVTDPINFQWIGARVYARRSWYRRIELKLVRTSSAN